MQKVDKLMEKVHSIRDNDLVAARKEIEAAEKLVRFHIRIHCCTLS
jgi:hypothetical protein